MGYTHYWQYKRLPGLSTEGRRMLREILAEAYCQGIIQREYDLAERPVLTKTEIRFNGVGENGHETFCFNVGEPANRPSGWHFSFCKTVHKPYDDVVMRVLIVLKHIYRDLLAVTSDGRFEQESASARREMKARYGIRTVVGRELVMTRKRAA